MNIIGVTNRKLCEDFYKRIEEISKLNLKYLILREKDLEDDELLLMARKVDNILKSSNIKLIINSNKEVAIEISAYGLQLSYKEFISRGRGEFRGVIGVSIHSFDEAINSYNFGADYLIYGHVYETECKEGVKPRGLGELKEICKSISIPVYAIGGINKSNYKYVMDSGIKGVAIMSSLMKGNKIKF